MTPEFKTDIVKTKESNRIFMIVCGILYVVSSFYLYSYDTKHENIYLTSLALAIHISGTYFLFKDFFIKPKKIGSLKISIDGIECNKNGKKNTIAINELENICLKYMDYGSWITHSKFGDKNYLKITEKSGKIHDLEILIRNKNSKNDLKKILNKPEYYEKFNFIKDKSSRTEF